LAVQIVRSQLEDSHRVTEEYHINRYAIYYFRVIAVHRFNFLSRKGKTNALRGNSLGNRVQDARASIVKEDFCSGVRGWVLSRNC